MTPPGRIAESSADKPSLVVEFGSAAIDSAIQKPINGLSQLGSELSGYELPQLHLLDVPKAQNGADVFAQQAGSAVGSLVPFLGVRAAVRGTLGNRLGDAYLGTAVEGGLTGLTMGTVLTPVERNQPFWSSRLANGLTDAGTFALLNVAGKGLGSTKALAVDTETSLAGRIFKGGSVGILAGLPSGFAHAELNSITHGRGAASSAEIAGDMTGFALFGGIFGGVGGAIQKSPFHKLASEQPSVQKPLVETEIAKPAETLQPERPAESTQPGRAVETKVSELRTAEKPVADNPENIISVKKATYIDAGDEGKVYSNGDGTVTKVFHDKAEDLASIKEMFDKLESIGIRLPKILEMGRTEDGLPAMKMEQVGDGDHLQTQMLTGELTPRDYLLLKPQYYGFADAIRAQGWRIDWNLKNMTFQNGKLYILDPSFLKEQELPESTIQHYAGRIGPR